MAENRKARWRKDLLVNLWIRLQEDTQCMEKSQTNANKDGRKQKGKVAERFTGQPLD